MKRTGSQRILSGLRRKGETSELAARLAPLEEQRESGETSTASSGASQLVTHEDGAIVVGTQRLSLSKDVVELQVRRAIEPVVIVIVGLLLTYILFVAWQISQMP